MLHRVLRRVIRVAAIVSLGASAAAAQAGTTGAGATVTGSVHERLNGTPLALATVALDGTDRVVFTRGSGAFAISGVTPGAHTLRIRQIGFAPATLRVTALDSGLVEAGDVRLERLAVTLTTVEVRARPGDCRGTNFVDPATDTLTSRLLDRLSDQSDRLRAFAVTYPGTATMVTTHDFMDGDGRSMGARTDTSSQPIVRMRAYHVGGVVTAAGPGSRYQFEVHLISAVQLSSAEFLAHHCVRYAGTTQTDGEMMHRFDLAPTSDVRAPDIIGSVYVTDAGVLRLTAFHVVNATDDDVSNFAVTVRYRPAFEGRISLVESVETVQPAHSPAREARMVRKVVELSRVVARQYAGARPDSDTAATVAR